MPSPVGPKGNGPGNNGNGNGAKKEIGASGIVDTSLAAAHLRKARYNFKTKKMRDVYEGFRSDVNRLDLRDELALARTVLTAVIEKSKAQEPSDMSAAEMSTIIHLVHDVGDLCEQIARIQKIGQESVAVEHIRIVMDQMVGVMSKHLTWRDIEKIILGFEQIDLPVGGLKGVAGNVIPGAFLGEGKEEVE